MRVGVLIASVLPLVLVGAACEHKAPPPPQVKPSAPTTNLSLPERLAEEAKSRPDGAIRMEDIAAALKDKGVEVARTRQVLAAVLGARYCATATTGNGLSLASCEYESHDAATAGMALSHEKFDAKLPGRTLEVNGKTLLSVSPADAAQRGDAEKVTTLFAMLSPR